MAKRSSTIRVAIDSNSFRLRTQPVHQYDRGVVLHLTGQDVSNVYQVHFSNEDLEQAVTVLTTLSGEELLAKVPDELLALSKDIDANVYEETAETGLLIKEITIPVVGRKRPTRLVYEDQELEPINQMTETLEALMTKANTLIEAAETKIMVPYPVGSVYISLVDTNPATYFGGVWETIEGKFLLAASDDYEAGTTGGEAAHILTQDEMPSHSHKYNDSRVPGTSQGTLRYTSGSSSHSYKYANASTDQSRTTGSSGGTQAHNNMPPYLAVYMWKRVL